MRAHATTRHVRAAGRRAGLVAALTTTALLLAGCGGDGDGGNAAGCKEAVADAAEATNMPERERRLRPAFDACGSLAEFAAAVAQSPEALEGVDVEAWVREQCRESQELREAKLCEAFG